MKKALKSLTVVAIVVLLSACGKDNDNGANGNGGNGGNGGGNEASYTPNNLKIHSARGVFKEQPNLAAEKVFTFILTTDYKAKANYEIDECLLDNCVKNSIRIICIDKSTCEVSSLRMSGAYVKDNVQSVSISGSSSSQKQTLEVVHSSLYTKLGNGHQYKVRAFDAAGTRSETVSIVRE